VGELVAEFPEIWDVMWASRKWRRVLRPEVGYALSWYF
jgi:hypothetical protein